MSLSTIKQALIHEIALPDFKGRHLFVAKLRVTIFILSWVLFIFLYPGIWKGAPFVPLIFNLGFLLTSFCYSSILNETNVLVMSFVEVFADIISQTAIIYLMGPDTLVIYLFFGLYVIAAGSFFGYFASLFSATACLISYGFLLFALQSGWIDPFVYPTDAMSWIHTREDGYFFNMIGLPIALGIIVYGTRIAHFFSKLKERDLETRNVQLEALNRIGSTIRRAMNSELVIDHVLKGVIQGLDFDVCFLALKERADEKLVFYAPTSSPLVAHIEETLQSRLSSLSLSLLFNENAIVQSIQKNRIIIRNDFFELMRGFQGESRPDIAKKIQKELGFKKFIITPLVAERKVIGALIGASSKDYIDESVVNTLDHFSNQAALAIETVQLIEELKSKNTELEKANKIKSEFLAIMSHELRTPLTAIMGYTEILLDSLYGETTKEQKESLQEVYKNAEHLLELINGILDLAKVEAGKMGLNLEEFAIGGVVQDVAQTLHPLVAKKEQSLLVDIPNDLPSIVADSRKLRQILLNLAGNAIKFTPEKGKIIISVQYYIKPDVLNDEFKLTAGHFRGGVFRVSVKDFGIGIKSENLSQLFEIFHQVDSTFTRKHQGTGLGLALTRQLVELHGGLITVSSEYGKGSEFKFLLPEQGVG